jgi:5-methylcytosine-specific restriction endonuclease McrA
MEQSELAPLENASPLNGSVLVLNRFYMAVHVVSVRRALGLLYRELAEVINIEDGQYANYDFEAWVEMSQFIYAEIEESSGEVNEDEDRDWIRSVNFPIQVPRVIRLSFYDKVPKLTLRFNRRNLFGRDKNTCQYCGVVKPLAQLSFDHVVPTSRGGETSWENVVCCCLKCNGKKGDKLPSEANMNLIKKPVRPRHNPLVTVRLNNPKYEMWRTFLGGGQSVAAVGSK